MKYIKPLAILVTLCSRRRPSLKRSLLFTWGSSSQLTPVDAQARPRKIFAYLKKKACNHE